jgi:L-asparaginase / beta-aspartyl-peptidase
MVHGGAKDIAPGQEEANRRGCLKAVEAGSAVLARGGTAVDAVEVAIRVLEDDPTFNAGLGSVRNEAGEIEMDAAVMDGNSLAIGAVAAVTGVRHPVSVARLMLSEPPTLLVAEGARRFAVEHGAELCNRAGADCPGRLHTPRDDRHDTVGCVALDQAGAIAAATSTGGLEGTFPGRVGDSPLPGCGFYADSTVGGVAFSGDGENIARSLLAARVMQSMHAGSDPQSAVCAALAALRRTGGEAGGIAVNSQGGLGFAHNSSSFAVSWVSDDMPEPRVSLRSTDT